MSKRWETVRSLKWHIKAKGNPTAKLDKGLQYLQCDDTQDPADAVRA